MVQDPDNLSQFLSYGPQINELEEKEKAGDASAGIELLVFLASWHHGTSRCSRSAAVEFFLQRGQFLLLSPVTRKRRLIAVEIK